MGVVIRDVSRACEALANERVIGVDIETSGLSPFYDEIMVVSMYGEESGECTVLHVKADIPYELRDFLAKPRSYIFHNGVGFDVLFFKQQDIHFPMFYDTLVAEQVLDTTSRKDVRKNLGAVMKRRIGASFKGEIDHKSWQAPELNETQVEYAANDVRYLPKLMRRQVDLCQERGLMDALTFETELMPIVVDMEFNGLELDVPILERKLQEVAANAEKSIQRLGNINPNSPQQIKRALADKGLTLPNTRVETLQEVIVGEGPHAALCQDILTARRARKRTGMYDSEFVSKYITEGRVHSRFWQVGTGTARFSSSDPNLQQIPRDLRSIVGNRPGHKVVAADYGQIELRIMAALAEDEVLADDLESVDIHAQMAELSFGIPPEEQDKETRFRGKAVSFTWTFVGGPDAVVANAMKYGQVMSWDVADQALKNIKKRYYKTTAFQNTAKSRARRRGAVNLYLPAGHRRTLVGSYITPSAIVNTLVQGTAAGGLKYGLFELEKAGLMKYVGATVHDEVVSSGVPDNEAEDYAVAMADAMRIGMEKVCSVPVVVDTKVGDSWS